MFTTNKLIVVSGENSEDDNFYCKICEFPLITNKDFINNLEYECCNSCYLKFAESRKIKWKNGWRPKRNLVDSYLKERKDIYKSAGDKSEF